MGIPVTTDTGHLLSAAKLRDPACPGYKVLRGPHINDSVLPWFCHCRAHKNAQSTGLDVSGGDVTMLQRGRARGSAERPYGNWSTVSRTPGFNGAALTRARRGRKRRAPLAAHVLASTGPRSHERGEVSRHRHDHRLHLASTGPRSHERGECSPVTPSGAGSQYFACDSLCCFECLSACDVQLSRHYQLVLRRLRSASAGGVFGITSPLACY